MLRSALRSRAVATSVVAGAAALTWAAATWRHGMAWSPDSMVYGSVARAIARGDGLRTPLHDHQLHGVFPAMTYWPPGYPALVAAASGASGGDVARAAEALGPTLFVATTALVCALLARLTGRPDAAWLAAWSCLFAPLVREATWVHSELAFVALWLVGALALHGALAAWDRDGRVPLARLAGAGALAGALLLVRHAGAPFLVLVPAAVLVHGLAQRRPAAGVGAAVAACGGAIGLVAGPWILFSHAANGRFGYPYPPGITPAWTVIEGTAAAWVASFVESLAPVTAGRWLEPWLPFAAAGFAVAVGIGLASAVRRTDPGERPAAARTVEGLLVAQGLASLALFTGLRITSQLDDPDVRLLLPATLPVLLVGLAAVGRRVGAWAPLLGGAALGWVAVLAPLRAVGTAPAGPDWFAMPFIRDPVRWARDHGRPDDLIVTPWATWVHWETGRPVMSWLPPTWGEPLSDADLRTWVGLWQEQVGGRVVVLAQRGPGVELPGRLAEFADGAPDLRALGLEGEEIAVDGSLRVWVLHTPRTEPSSSRGP